MSSLIPPDFGGFLCFWKGDRAIVVRCGQGKPVESMQLTPLNLLQLRKTLDTLIEQGDREGHITEEHRRQSNLLLASNGMEQIMPRDEVDRIAGSD